MASASSVDRLFLCTQNRHKLDELTPLFDEYGVTFETTSIEKYEIRADDVEVVAREAALHAYKKLGSPVVVDDTGLWIDALNGFPRAYPAFVLETIGKQGILKLLTDIHNRAATFVTAVGYCDSSGPVTFVGKMNGSISMKPIGTGGFGYDPIFIPSGDSRTYSQLSMGEKIQVSHRTKAFQKFLAWYTEARK